jgi:hypothetical protein
MLEGFSFQGDMGYQLGLIGQRAHITRFVRGLNYLLPVTLTLNSLFSLAQNAHVWNSW